MKKPSVGRLTTWSLSQFASEPVDQSIILSIDKPADYWTETVNQPVTESVCLSISQSISPLFDWSINKPMELFNPALPFEACVICSSYTFIGRVALFSQFLAHSLQSCFANTVHL